MSNTIETYFRQIYKALDELDRRLYTSQMSGKVVERKGDKIRLELQQKDTRTGKAFLSPWVQFQEAAGAGMGGFSSHTPPAIGETMRLFSPSGEIGEHSLAVRDGYTQDNPKPTGNENEHVFVVGNARIEFGNGYINLLVGGQGLRLTAEELLTTLKIRLNNGDRKVHYKGALDSDGDVAIDGAEDVFV